MVLNQITNLLKEIESTDMLLHATLNLASMDPVNQTYIPKRVSRMN